MCIISEISSLRPQWEGIQEPKGGIRVEIDAKPYLPELVVTLLAIMQGPVDIYCWYEGAQFLPQVGASFMKTAIFEPLYRLKQDVKIYLYSLKAWGFNKNLLNMPPSTPIGEAINRINKAAVECIYSASFFRYCAENGKESRLYDFLSEELPQKEWLVALSERQKKKGVTIKQLFNERSCLFDCIKDLDSSEAYSLMQYVEGYFLIQQSVRKGLLNGQKKIQIAFVLPNDEGKYYLDYPKDIEKMLQIDFGKDLNGVEITISFRFFKYGEGDSLDARPYIDKRPKAPKVGVEEIDSYFDYLHKPLFLRDVIHNVNGWY